MHHFLGRHRNRIDAKGRVSIPADYRAALRALAPEGAAPLVLRLSHKGAFIEGWPVKFFDELAAPLARMDVFDDDHDDLAMALYADAAQYDPDKEGRIGLTEELMAHAGLTDTALFLGSGRYFQIWEPDAGERQLRDIRERARARQLTLRRAPEASA
jgi:MraZ protein